jgi:histidinol-phosphatase
VATAERRPERARSAEAGTTIRSDDLELAHRLAELAAEIALAHFARGVETIVKPDGTPVSEADLEVDRELVARLVRERPDDEVLSEESGPTEPAGASSRSGGSGRRWILDPIDGTFNFVDGQPAWGTHIALEDDGEIVLGLISRPSYGLVWWATSGGGAFRSAMGGGAVPERLSVSTVASLDAARVTTWPHVPRSVVSRLRKRCTHVQATLDSALEVVQGDLEAVIDAGGVIWDQAPAVVLLAEAGGVFDDGEGGRRADLGRARYTNGVIDAALADLIDP